MRSFRVRHTFGSWPCPGTEVSYPASAPLILLVYGRDVLPLFDSKGRVLLSLQHRFQNSTIRLPRGRCVMLAGFHACTVSKLESTICVSHPWTGCRGNLIVQLLHEFLQEGANNSSYVTRSIKTFEVSTYTGPSLHEVICHDVMSVLYVRSLLSPYICCLETVVVFRSCRNLEHSPVLCTVHTTMWIK